MRDLSVYAAQCRRELDRLQIPYAAKIVFTINTRAKTRLGLCKRNGGGYIIEIAASLLDETVPEKLLKETLLHELLHSCAGCMNHSDKWKALADRVNAAYGYDICRIADKDALPQQVIRKPCYRFACPHCGESYLRLKRSSVTEHPERYRCGKCGQPMSGTVIYKL